jgi:hypothetical protein
LSNLAVIENSKKTKKAEVKKWTQD